MNSNRKFSLQIGILLSLLLIIAVTVFILIQYVFNINEKIESAKEDQVNSLFYVDELRQSSDDLTKMARLYVISQDSLYLSYFNQILQIRDGIISRPIEYNDIYWDYLLADGKIPRPAKDSIPLVDLIKSSCKSEEAIQYFIRAKKSSDDLVAIEKEAFNAIKGIYKDSLNNYTIIGEPNKELAVELLHNKEYLQAKVKIMKSIQDFNHFVKNNSISQIQIYQSQKQRINTALISIMTLAILLMVVILIQLIRSNKKATVTQKGTTIRQEYYLRNILQEVQRSWHLILLAFVFSVIIIIAYLFTSRIVEDNVKVNLKQSLETILETTQNNILNWLVDVEAEINSVVHPPEFQQLIKSSMVDPTDVNKSSLDYYLNHNILQSSFVGFLVIDKKGEIVIAKNDEWQASNITSLDHVSFFQELSNKDIDIAISMPKSKGFSAEYNQMIKMGYSFFSQEDKYLGSIIFMFEPDNRFTYVLQGGRVGNSGESYAFNIDGEMISESRFDAELVKIGLLKEKEKSLLNIVLKDPGVNLTKGHLSDVEQNLHPFTAMAKDALQGYNGVNIDGYNDYRGVKVIGVWNWIEKYGFGIATEIDYSEGYKTFLLISKISLYSAIAFILLLFSLTGIFILNKIKQSSLNEKISQQKLLLENTLESLTHPFYVVDAKDYSLLLANSAAKKLGDTENNKCYALTHKRGEPCDSIEDPCPLKIVKDTKKPVVLEHTHYDAEGNSRIVEVSGYPIFNEQGEVVQMIEYSIDITDRKKAEQDLLAANQRFEAIVNNLADALIIINDKGIIEFFSPSAEILFQYEGVEVMGDNIKVLMPAPHHENHDEYLSRYYETGEARVVGIEREVEARRKDGSLFPARLMISEVKTANHHFFVGLIGDLTERNLAEKQLKTQAAAMESAANGIVITNQLGIIHWVNPALHKLTGYKPEELIGNNPSVLKSGKHDDDFYANMWETITKGEVWHDEIINKKKNGDLYYEEMTLTPVFDDKGNITQFVAIKQDITERKRLEAIVLKAKERMEGELNVAKDIQMSMLPLIFPAFPQRKEIELYAELIPAREVGGDFYDFYFLDENHFCFVVGDVSGKGVPAALMMAVTKTLLKSQAVNDRSTASILTHVNNEIAKDNDTYMFITVFMAILDTNTGELVYSNAGHNPSFILDGKHKRHIKLGDLHGPVIGAMEEMTYKETSLMMNKDDLIVAYTDGVTESQNMNEELYSDERFIQLLESESKSSPQDLIKKIIDSVKSFEGEAEQFDDITLLAIRYMQEPNTISSDKTSIKIKNDLKEITAVIDHFEIFGEKNNISFPIIQKFNIAFDELLNNNISYGFEDNSEHIIDVEIELKGSRLIITIADDGMPFNPFVKNPPDTKLSVSERDIGGLGIHIVKNLMDEFDYKRSADKNIITLIKHNINT